MPTTSQKYFFHKVFYFVKFCGLCYKLMSSVIDFGVRITL